VDCTGEAGSKKSKTVFPAGKLKTNVFWDSHGVILINYLQKGRTISLDMLKAELS
jgi:hypothetical protein